MPGATANVDVQGPAPGMTMVSLDDMGMLAFQHNIDAFGAYTVNVNVNGAMGSAMIEVHAPQVPCP
jgi:hypothetical protein